MSRAKEMNVMDHLAELRKRIMWIAIVVVITTIGGLAVANPIVQYLKMNGPAADLSLHGFSPWDGMRIWMQVAFMIAITISLPFILYQIWLFVKPGLRKEEQTATVKYIPIAAVLFLIGLSFAYFLVFPMAFKFTMVIAETMGMEITYGLANYFSFMFNILLPISVLFELPVVIMFLTRLRILNPMILRKIRKVSYFILVIVSTLVTPPDAISAILVAIPLIGLYELSVFLSKRVHQKQLEADAKFEAEGSKDSI